LVAPVGLNVDVSFAEGGIFGRVFSS